MFHGPPPAKIKRELTPSKELSPCRQDRSPMPYGEKCLYSHRYVVDNYICGLPIYQEQGSRHWMAYWLAIPLWLKVFFCVCVPSHHPQCLWQEAHSRVQAINSPLNTCLSLRPYQHSRNTPTEWAGPPSSPPRSQSDPKATSSTRATAYNGKHWISEPASTPSPQPQPTLRCALCTHQPGCQPLHTWAQVSTHSWTSFWWWDFVFQCFI